MGTWKPVFLILILSICSQCVLGQSHTDEIKEFQKTLNEEFLDSKTSPLSKKERRKFKGHNYFAVAEQYRVTALLVKNVSPVKLQMKTSDDQLKDYNIYGKVEFELEGEIYELNIYQSYKLRQIKKYKDYLFLPFTDLTNSVDTYGGGRYIDLQIPKGDSITIDFNKAYNPSCAYSYDYSCPIPPAENDLDIRIEAGVKHQH